jgi:hypothetical protein
MPRRHKHKKMRGGFDPSTWGTSISNTFSSLGSNVSSLWNKAKNQTTYFTPTTSTQSSYLPSTSLTTGGKKKYTKRMRGGVMGWTPLTGIGAHGAPVSGLAVAKAHTYVGGPNYVGGKTRRRYHKKTRRH